MNHLIILSGGTGSRMGFAMPKQYAEIRGKPVIVHTLECFDFTLFGEVVMVVANDWREFAQKTLASHFPDQRFLFAEAGCSRQQSAIRGLMLLKGIAKDDDIVLIHDGARPNCSKRIVSDLISACAHADGAVPVAPVKDAVYVSDNGTEISSIPDRSKLYFEQTPEAFVFGKFLKANQHLSPKSMERIRGCAQIAFEKGLRIALVKGDEDNFKLTTPDDMRRFRLMKRP